MAAWIALAAVFIALIPVFVIASERRAGKKNGPDVDGSATTYASTDSSDCESDGGGDCD